MNVPFIIVLGGIRALRKTLQSCHVAFRCTCCQWFPLEHLTVTSVEVCFGIKVHIFSCLRDWADFRSLSGGKTNNKMKAEMWQKKSWVAGEGEDSPRVITGEGRNSKLAAEKRKKSQQSVSARSIPASWLYFSKQRFVPHCLMLQRHRALAGRAIQVTSSNLLPHLIRHVSFLKLNLIRIIIFFLVRKAAILS